MADEINASVMAPVVSTFPAFNRSLAFRDGKTHSGSNAARVDLRLNGDIVHFFVTFVFEDNLKIVTE